MSIFSIGLSGLDVAQRAIELVGTNIANATTPGYHRQEAVVRPLDLNTYGNVPLGGAEITEVRRIISGLLEGEISRQTGTLSQTSQELETLESVEVAFNDLDAGGLSAVLDDFFNALTELAAQPTSQALREQVLWAADSLAGRFRHLAEFLGDMQGEIRLEAEQYVNQVNVKAREIADLNVQIASSSMRGASVNLLADRRDQAIMELSELLGIQVRGQTGPAGMANVSAWGKPIVTSGEYCELELRILEDGRLGVAAVDAAVLQTDLQGGKLAALLNLSNNVLAEIQTQLDTLARQVTAGINQLHVQGVGTGGSFDALTGVPVTNDPLGDWQADVAAGSFYIRVIDQATGEVTRQEIAVDPTVDTVSTIQASLDALDHISASIVDSALHIEADTGYQFDFLPEVLSQPYTNNITGSAAATISGAYEGRTNQIFTCTVVGTGQVGVTDNLVLEVRDGDGQLVRTVDVGLGYAAGDWLDISNGLRVSFGVGQLNDGDEFTIQALATTDTSGFLAAAGINTLFTGETALRMAVRQEVFDDPQRLAAASGSAGSDGRNVLAMVELGQSPLDELNDMTASEYYNQIVVGIGHAVVTRQAKKDSLDNVIRQLEMQRDGISGVDLNEEAAKLIVFERMYQAISRAIATQDQALQYLFDLI